MCGFALRNHTFRTLKRMVLLGEMYAFAVWECLAAALRLTVGRVLVCVCCRRSVSFCRCNVLWRGVALPPWVNDNFADR